MKFLPRRESHAKRKAKAFRATEASVDKHQSAMAAIQKAALSTTADGSEALLRGVDNPWHGREKSMDSGWLHGLPTSNVEVVGSPEQKVSAQRRKGLITDNEAAMEKGEIAMRKED